MGRNADMGLNQEVLPLTEAEIPMVLAMREEEKLARDVYLLLDEQYLSPVFQNIARSEQRHMDAIAMVIKRQGLTDPVTDSTVGKFTSSGFAELYDTLIQQGSADYIEALTVGAYIEEIDIKDLQEALVVVTTPQLVRVFENLLRGSYNHLRAFTAALAAEGITYAPQVLTPEAYDTILNPPAPDRNGNVNGQKPGNRQGQGGQGRQR
jgi:hypothetical protein